MVTQTSKALRTRTGLRLASGVLALSLLVSLAWSASAFASLAPVFPQEPEVLFVHSSSVVLHGSVNPQGTLTKYYFAYGACEPVSACASSTPVHESAANEEVAVTQEVTGLQSGTTYHYRFVASNENGQTSESTEGTFTTQPPVIPQAITGSTSAIRANSALISGQVDPDGQPAVYAFELGVYNATATRYGIVYTASAGAGTSLASQTLELSGLQPGRTYSYRINIESGYGSATGDAQMFTTLGAPAILPVATVLPQLATPEIAFPFAPASSQTKTLSRAQKLARALKACRKTPKRRRAACERTARNRNGAAQHHTPKHTKKGSKK